MVYIIHTDIQLSSCGVKPILAYFTLLVCEKFHINITFKSYYFDDLFKDLNCFQLELVLMCIHLLYNHAQLIKSPSKVIMKSDRVKQFHSLKAISLLIFKVIIKRPLFSWTLRCRFNAPMWTMLCIPNQAFLSLTHTFISANPSVSSMKACNKTDYFSTVFHCSALKTTPLWQYTHEI